MGASSRPSRAVSPPTREVDGVGDQPGAAIVGPDPQVLGGRRAVIGGGVGEASSSAHPSSGSASGSPIHSTRKASSSFSSSMNAEGAGVVTRRHRPAPVERGAEHRHDADDDGRRGQPGRDLPPPEPVAREVDLEGRRPPWRPRGPGRRPRGRGAPPRLAGGRRRRLAGRPRRSRTTRCARVHPRTAHVWRSARAIRSGKRGRHEEAPPERRHPQAARCGTGAGRRGRTDPPRSSPPVKDCERAAREQEVEGPRQVQQHGDERADQRMDSRRSPPRGFIAITPPSAKGGTDEHEQRRRRPGRSVAARAVTKPRPRTVKRHVVSRTPGPTAPPRGPNGAIRLARASIATMRGAAA